MTLAYAHIRALLLARQEIALIDVREEDRFAQAHPLWAANFPLSRLELEAWRRIPRRDTLIVVYGEDRTARAIATLTRLGYTSVHELDGGLDGWRAAGGELFRDVNVPSKAFGEYVEAHRHTPSLDATAVKELIDRDPGLVVLDVRRFDEYQTMTLPGSVSVPGAELVLRARQLAPNPGTRIIVHCAGRTRSIIGTQSLINAGLPNPIAALRNGTIGWVLAGHTLEQGASRRFPADLPETVRAIAQVDARQVAARAGVSRIAASALDRLAEAGRTLYRFDVRSPEEFAAGHLPGFTNVPGGQLVQESDHDAPVRGARLVLADDDGVRADMTASWLAQMGWEVQVVDPVDPAYRTVTGPAAPPQPLPPAVPLTTATALAARLEAGEAVQILDVTGSANYVRRHIPGAWFTVRADLAAAVRQVPAAELYVLTCGTSLLARFAAADLRDVTDTPVMVLEGGTAAWVAAGLPVQEGESYLASPRIDRYRRPYEGTDNNAAAMQAYLDWEFGLVEQLARDGTHNFTVI
ncbi:MAG: rhodanese homology domain-containing protein [Azospirillaceae bacterium]|nr:rhodanese homology domain-containing protein [Azospirillaceae bacterium]